MSYPLEDTPPPTITAARTVAGSEAVSVTYSDGATVWINPTAGVRADQLATWIAGGGQMQVDQLPVQVPAVVDLWQARQALKNAGLFTQIDAAMIAADGAAQEAWTNGNTIRRDAPIVTLMASSLGLTSQQVDALFIAAAEIVA